VADPLAWQHKLDSLKAQRAELFQRISESFEADDLVVSDIKADGRALVTMALAPGRVTLGPLHTLGERLVNHLLREEPEKWMPKVQSPIQNGRKVQHEAQPRGSTVFAEASGQG
jgi:hypothetical protein